jgi:hypothetical protein
MDFNLPENPTFTQLKTWFESNRNELPNTLQGDGVFYINVKHTADIIIQKVEHRISVCDKPAKDRIAISEKNQLFKLYQDLQNREEWNKPLPKLNKFSNKMNQ